MGVKYVLYDYSKEPPSVVTVDSVQLTNLFNTLPKNKKIEFAIQEPNFEPITIGHYIKISDSPTINVLYDSLRDSRLHDGIVRTVQHEGSLGSNGKGVECRASGSPRIKINADKTFSLLCDSGHGRFYCYTTNYNATLEIEAAFWNSASGQDESLKIRSKHNEDVNDESRNNNDFGGYGFSSDRSGWGAKREPFHNEHDQSVSGSFPSKPETGKYFKIEFTVKDEGNDVRQIVKYNGQQIMSRLDSNPEPYMVGEARYMSPNQSYFWVRQNIDSGTGELRIKRIRVLKV